MSDILIIDAVYQAYKYGNNKPLIALIESDNKEMLSDKLIKDFLVKKIHGKSILGPGQKFTTQRKEARDRQIIDYLYLLKGYKIPVTSKKKSDKKDGCDYAAEKFNLAEGTIYDIWKDRGKTKTTWTLNMEIGAALKKAGYEIG